MDSMSVLRTTQQGIQKAFEDHYRDVFCSTWHSQEVIDRGLDHVKSQVSDAMNEQLQREFTRDEVDEVLFSMGPLKSPRPDGFEACFYQDFWNVVGDDVANVLLRFLNNGAFDEQINTTHIVLILRVETPRG